MIRGSKEKLDKIAQDYVCAEHKRPLTVAWHAKENTYVLRCGEGEYPEEVTRNLSPTEQVKRGEIEPAGHWFNLLPKTDLGSGELLGQPMINALVDYAVKYGLDPYRGHVMIMYGKPYIGLDGYMFHANRSGIHYNIGSRPLDKAERELYQVGEGDHAWISEVEKLGARGKFTGIGIVTRQELDEEVKGKPGQKRYPVVAAHPWQLAQKRAEWQAMRRAFPIGETEEKEEE